ncbi:MAG: DNA polymerase III subunit delta [Candidatus Eiseniibacteriota bacterium]
MPTKKAASKSTTAKSAAPKRAAPADKPAAKKPPASRSTSKIAAPRAGGPAACEAWLARSAESPGTTYIQGNDEALKAEILTALKEAWLAAVPDSPPVVLRAGEAGPAGVLNAVQGGSLFVSRSLVIVLRAEDWARSATQPAAVGAALAQVPPENLLVFVESAGDSERKHLNPLRAACTRVFAIDGLPPSELRAWAERHAKRQGLTLAPDAWDALFDLPRLDTGEAFNELDKLAAWAGDGGRANREQVLAIVHPAGGATLGQLADAVSERRGAEAMDCLLRALEGGESSGSILFQLVTLLGGALRLRGGGGGWIRDRRRSQRVAETWRPDEIARGLDLLYRCERAWKTGQAPEETLLVRAVQGLTA